MYKSASILTITIIVKSMVSIELVSNIVYAIYGLEIT